MTMTSDPTPSTIPTFAVGDLVEFSHGHGTVRTMGRIVSFHTFAGDPTGQESCTADERVRAKIKTGDGSAHLRGLMFLVHHKHDL